MSAEGVASWVMREVLHAKGVAMREVVSAEGMASWVVSGKGAASGVMREVVSAKGVVSGLMRGVVSDKGVVSGVMREVVSTKGVAVWVESSWGVSVDGTASSSISSVMTRVVASRLSCGVGELSLIWKAAAPLSSRDTCSSQFLDSGCG